MSNLAEATPVQLAYLAGLIDSGGTIGISRSVRKGRPYYQARVIAARGDRAALKPLEVLGLGLARPTNKVGWRWEIASASALAFLVAVRPYLVAKASKADLVVKLISHNRRSGRHGMTAAEKAGKEECYASFQSINQRSS